MEVCRSRRRWVLVLAAAAAASNGLLGALSAKDPTANASRRDLASASVREALQHEVYGLDNERNRLLEEAAKQDPSLEAPKWHAGQVKDEHGKWIDFEQFQDSAGLAKKLPEYNRIRNKYPDTVDGQLTIAAWCAKQKMWDQRRAHLSRVIELEPDHAEARQMLGFVRLGGAWVGNDEIAREQRRAQQADKDLKTWRPALKEIVKDLTHRSEERQQAAKDRLLAIHDPAALPAMVELAFSAEESVALLMLDAAAQIQSPEASLALAQVAAMAPAAPVRKAAAEKLQDRDFDEFVPQLISSLYSPVTSRAAATLLPNGRMAFRQIFLREGHDRQDVLQLDTQYERRARFGGSQSESTGRAAMHILNQAAQREVATQQQNAMTQAVNERIMWVLRESTGQQFADVSGWWNWWNERNEVFQGTSKSVAFVSQQQTVQVVDYVPPPPQQSSSSKSGGGTPSSGTGGGTQVRERRRGGAVAAGQFFDCLAAGTKVWTVDGQAAIETVRVGDLVLSRNPDSGELAYKPVLRTTVRPKGALIRIKLDGESIETSGGHLFWVSGDGWVRSRDLQPGMILHGVDGSSRVQLVEKSNEAETYNVIVADFNTYFVGDSKVLSHDNTVRQPTAAIVPGLRME